MKRIFKLLLLSFIVGVPTSSAVSCAPTQKISDEDILQSAIGRMQSHTFGLKELNLDKLPKANEEYKNLSENSKNEIVKYYASLVDNSKWDYPTVAVSVVEGENFINRYGENVEAKSTLTIELKYQDISRKVNVLVKINNDNVTKKEKLESIKNYFETKIPEVVVKPKTLFKNGLKSDDSSFKTELSQIQQALRLAVLNSEIIDVEGVDLEVIGANIPDEPVYELSAASESKTIDGELKNLKLVISLDDDYLDAFEMSQKLQVKQSISDANNQLANILNQSPEVLKFYFDELPDSNDSFDDVVKNQNTFLGDLQKKLFDNITKIYPEESNWNSKLITVQNTSTMFIKEDNESGYFLVDLQLSGVFENNNLTAGIKNIRLNIFKNKNAFSNE